MYIDTSVLVHFPSTHHGVVIEDSPISSNDSKHLETSVCLIYLRTKFERDMSTMVSIDINNSGYDLSKKKVNLDIVGDKDCYELQNVPDQR